MTTPEISADVETLLLCITNEGELYPRLMAMGADAANHSDSDWHDVARAYVRRLQREHRYDGDSSAATVGAFAAKMRDTYIAKARELHVWEHNPDANPNWTPLVRWRAYRCNQCDAEQKMQTNHTGTVWNARCVGRCRTITNPHTAREVVSPYYGPHRYIRDEAAEITAAPISRTGPDGVTRPGEDVTRDGETWFHPYNGGAPSVLVAYGADELDRLAGCDLPGQLVPLRFPRFALVEALESTWREVVLAYVKAQRGPVVVADLYRALARHPKAKANTNWRAKVRQTLQRGPFERVAPATWAAAPALA